MKQIIIFLLIVIAALIGYGKYSQYQRYNSPGTDYTTDAIIDLNYHNQEVVMKYHDAIEALNGYVSTQWSANEIDVRTPENDDQETKVAVTNYGKKMAKVKYYETILAQSSVFKEKGMSNDRIKYLEENGLDIDTYKKATKLSMIKNMFDPSRNIRNKEKSVFIYEVQKQLVKNGFDIKVDGIYWQETSDAIKAFEAKNQLFADGQLDAITVDLLIK